MPQRRILLCLLFACAALLGIAQNQKKAAPKFVAAADIGEKNVSTDPTAMSPDLAVYTAVVFLIVLVVLSGINLRYVRPRG